MGGDEILQPAIHSHLSKAKEYRADNRQHIGLRLQQKADNQYRANPATLPCQWNACCGAGIAACCGRAGQPVNDNSQQHDHDASGKRLSKPCRPLVGGNQHLAANIVKTANHRGNDHHRQAGQHQLVDAHQNLVFGAGDLDKAKALPGCRA